jgi:hypothetical protein
VLLLIVAYAAAFRLDFEIGAGSAVPTELILVPMLFVLPVGLVPLAVAAGIVLGSLEESARGSLRLARVPIRVVNAWHAVGPALVLGLAGQRGPRLSDWPLYALALASQFGLDALTTAGREWLALGVRPSVQLRAMVWVYAIDAGLAPIGLAVAFAAQGSPYAVVLAPPLVGCSRCSRASGGCGSTTSSSCAMPTVGQRSCSATWSRPTTSTPASTATTWSS